MKILTFQVLLIETALLLLDMRNNLCIKMNLIQEEMVNMVYILGECEKNCFLASRVYAQRYTNSRNIRPESFEKVKERFEQTGNVHYKKREVINKTTINEENEYEVLQCVVENPQASTREIEVDLGISRSSVNRILKKHKYHAYHIELHQELYDRDYAKRVTYCQDMLNRIDNDPHFLNKILFCDESTFKSNGMVNRHNCHYYSTENPHWLREIDHQKKWSINVWGGVIGNHVIGPYFFDDTLNGEKYLQFLRDELPLLLQDIPEAVLEELYFQNDGAPAHYYAEVRTYLNNWRENKWIGRDGPINWPPRSPDLTLMDFFLWGYVKNKVYQEKPTSKENMKERIREVFRNITPAMLNSVLQENIVRFNKCIEEGGRLFEHLI